MTSSAPIPTSLLSDSLKGMSLDTSSYLSLMTKLIGESKHVQNNPRQSLVPREGTIVPHLLEILTPHSTSNGGPLILEELVYNEGRPNLLITYPGTSPTATMGLVGSHMDVVPANPENWDRDPFELTVEGDRMYGRGTTDCLGHVGMITLLFQALAVAKPVLKRSIVALFIVGEEGGEMGVGVDMVVKSGKIDGLKNGTCYWIDSADSQPCTGTAGAIQWHMKATGRLFHSGLPHRGINSFELASESMTIIQRRFYEDFPQHPKEEPYGFATPSTMKPTQVECARGALNQLPPWTTISGDIRLTPFYDVAVVVEKVNGYIAELNEGMEDKIPTRGPCSKYTLEGDDVDVKRGKLEMDWIFKDIEEVRLMEGIACDLTSTGLEALTQATKEVKGSVKPYAITGSLPLVRQMQNAGFDIQITGYGLSTTYHADNEYALISDMQDAFQILLRVISINEQTV
eukprot:CAMPEP_0194354438 /NCGR_PEP_ID=MMETSP0174-20130528/2601_1 /TAXON_ID=216777 /ORGANISM="Proboscia alata, Strain PI-D3" /LENGTH=457 /DNA_ID=CAMNT_0039123395 /DNA_START=71 /DNA_END=1444 /DNA_ORIENTATION=-